MAVVGFIAAFLSSVFGRAQTPGQKEDNYYGIPAPEGAIIRLIADKAARSRVAVVAYSPDGITVASGDRASGLVRLWDIGKRKEIHRFIVPGPEWDKEDPRPKEDQMIRGLEFSPTGDSLLVMANDPYLRVYDLSNRKLRLKLREPMTISRDRVEFTAATFVGKGTAIAGVKDKLPVYVWEAKSGEYLHSLDAKLQPPERNNPRHGYVCETLARSSEHDFVAVGVRWPGIGPNLGKSSKLEKPGDSIVIWSLQHKKVVAKLPSTMHSVSRLGLNPAGTLLMSSSVRGIEAWDVTKEKLAFRLDPPGDYYSFATLSPDGRMIAASNSVTDHGEHDSKLRVVLRFWEVWTGTSIGAQDLSFGSKEPYIADLVFSQDGKTVAALLITDDESIAIMRVPGAGGVPGKNLPSSKKTIHELWDVLKSRHAGEAYPAMTAIASKQDEASAFLAKQLQPVPVVTAKQIDQWIRDLDSGNFSKRDMANRALLDLGSEAEESIRKTLEDKTLSREGSSRAAVVLDAIRESPISSVQLKGFVEFKFSNGLVPSRLARS